MVGCCTGGWASTVATRKPAALSVALECHSVGAWPAPCRTPQLSASEPQTGCGGK